MRHAEFNTAIGTAQRDPPTGSNVLAAAFNFILGDNNDRVKSRVATGHRLLEENLSGKWVEIVVQETSQTPGLQRLGLIELIASLEANCFALCNQRRLAELIQSGSTVTLNLIAHQALIRVARERTVTNVTTGVFALKSIQASFVARKLRGC